MRFRNAYYQLPTIHEIRHTHGLLSKATLVATALYSAVYTLVRG
jgi:hypothetical protein